MGLPRRRSPPLSCAAAGNAAVMPAATLVFSPPLVIDVPRPNAVPPTVVVDCVAVLPKPRARLRLPPPLVITRPRPNAEPPTVVVSCPAKLNLPDAMLVLLPPLRVSIAIL